MEGVGRRQAGAEIAQALGARPHDEGRGAELLGEDDAVIAGIRLGQRREFVGRLPVEAAAVDDRAADGDAVAADPFGDRVHHQVGAGATIGRLRYGVANVLSIRSGIPAACAISAT